jgi:DNA polymerase-3 subunit alpha
VIATTACIGGILSKQCDYVLDMQGRAFDCIPPESFSTDLEFYLSIFDSDFYLELQDWDDGSHYQSVYNKLLLNTGTKRGIPFVITCDAHYLTPDDQKLHELLMAMQMKMTIQEYKDKGDMVYGPYFYLASPDEMKKRADHLECPSAWTNTATIAEQCNVEIKLNNWQLPNYPIEEEKDYSAFLIWKKEHHGT